MGGVHVYKLVYQFVMGGAQSKQRIVAREGLGGRIRLRR
ncbi:unnamed protein product [Brassica rapa subsp. trilocularis]